MLLNWKVKAYALFCVSIIRLINTIFGRFYKRKIPLKKINKILIVHPMFIGDTVILTPTIRAIRRKFTKAQLSILVFPIVKEVLLNNPYINEILICDNKTLNSWKAYSKFIKNLRMKRFNLVIDTQQGFQSLKRVLIPFLSGAKYRIGYKRGRGFQGFLNTNEVVFRLKHGVDVLLSLIAPLNILPSSKSLDFHITKEEESWAFQFLRNQGIQNDRLVIGIHPANKNKSKCWGERQFKTLIKIFDKEINAQIVLLGASDEMDQIQRILEDIKFPLCIAAGKTTIRQLAALIKKLDLLVSIDTCSIHIASATKTPTVGIYGPTYPLCWTPWNTQNQITITHFSKCKDCEPLNFEEIFFSQCCTQQYRCIKDITPKEVFNKSLDLLKQEGKIK